MNRNHISNIIWSAPGEVKHLSTRRNRKQQRTVFRQSDFSGGWKTVPAIPQVAASETGIAQTELYL